MREVIENLAEKTRRKPNIKNRIDQNVEDAINGLAIEFPAFGQVRASNELRKRGIFVSAAGVRCAWIRSDLETMRKRLKALDRKVQEEGIILTEAQAAALERKKDDDVACGEIETVHPGYLGSQDTFYVGCLKGVGRIYQQTFVDTYSKVAILQALHDQNPHHSCRSSQR